MLIQIYLFKIILRVSLRFRYEVSKQNKNRFKNLNFTNFENELTNPYPLYKKFINNKYNGHQLYNFDWYSKTF